MIIPEFVTQWKTQWLHNQSAFALKARLLYRPNTVVTSVPVLVDRTESEIRHAANVSPWVIAASATTRLRRSATSDIAIRASPGGAVRAE